MKLDRSSRELAYLDITADRDFDAGTLEVSIDYGPFEPWAWGGESSQVGGTWVRAAQRMVAGPIAPEPGDALVLPLGEHSVRWRLEGAGTESPVRSADSIRVS